METNTQTKYSLKEFSRALGISNRGGHKERPLEGDASKAWSQNVFAARQLVFSMQLRYLLMQPDLQLHRIMESLALILMATYRGGMFGLGWV